MKQKFTALDVGAVVRELRATLIPKPTLHGSREEEESEVSTTQPQQIQQQHPSYRLQNVYDVNQKTYLLKFARPDSKLMLLVESGARIHSTEFMRDKQGSQLPNGFCMKLRKHLRTKRLAAIRQLGKDRIVQLTFGGGESAYHLFCEFYASGNIVLTDHEYNILSLLRVVQPDEGVRFAVGERYPVHLAREPIPIAEDRLRSILQSAGKKDQLKKVMLMHLDYAQVLFEHCCIVVAEEAGGNGASQLQPNDRCSTLFNSSGQLFEEKVSRLLAILQMADRIAGELASPVATESAPFAGHIFTEPITAAALAKPLGVDQSASSVFVEFQPFPFKQLVAKYPNHLKFDSFNRACDQYFTAIESQRIEVKARQQEEAAVKKLENVRLEHQSRVKGLEEAQLVNDRKARLIELNLEMVDKCIMTVRSSIASGMDWVDLSRLVDDERRRGNPMALLIAGLKLETNQITLCLQDKEADGYSDDSDDDESLDGNEDDDDSKAVRRALIDVDLSMTAFANARHYYDVRKISAKKQEKTLDASSKALRSAEMKIRREMKETTVSMAINKIRKPFWFEKFQWFISTENYLVIGGRDAQQNEYLVKRHLRKGDVYVHADITGSSTLSQAGSMAIVYSRAWEAKIVTSAYWVHHDQVSKTAPSGEYLTTGSFMVRGKKNYLPPTPLLFGFGILFRVADECIPNHMHERRPHLRGGGGSNDDLDSLENANTASVINESPQSVSVESLVENSEMMQADDGQDITASSDSDTESESSAAKQDNSPTDNAPLSRPNDPAAVVVDKYNLQDFGASSETDDNNQTVVKALVGKDSGPARKYVSAKQRRRMKKGSGGPSAEMNADDSDEGSSNNDLQSKSDKKQQQQQQPVKQVRGKKGKLKRLERYKDQDEEERQLRMQLLGASEIKTSKLQLPVEDGKDDKAPQTKQQDDKSAAGKQGRNKPPAAATKQIQVSAKEQRDATAASATAPGDDETAEINRLLGEENLLPPDEDDPATLIDTLTGTPLPTDTIMFAVPTCAPLATIQSYKYRVKLIPGAMKKGKAARAALAHFSGMSDSPAEKAVMKAVTESELIQTMLGKVKVMLSSDNANKKRGKK